MPRISLAVVEASEALSSSMASVRHHRWQQGQNGCHIHHAVEIQCHKQTLVGQAAQSLADEDVAAQGDTTESARWLIDREDCSYARIARDHAAQLVVRVIHSWPICVHKRTASTIGTVLEHLVNEPMHLAATRQHSAELACTARDKNLGVEANGPAV